MKTILVAPCKKVEHSTTSPKLTQDATQDSYFLRTEMSTIIPSIASYHAFVIDHGRCLARRTVDAIGDTRYRPAVFPSTQCKRLPVRGSDICETCQAREHKASVPVTTGKKPKSWSTDGWHGRVTDADLPARSHFAGSAWFHTKKPVWTGVAKPLTTKQLSPNHPTPAWTDVTLHNHVVEAKSSDNLLVRLMGGITGNLVSAKLLRDEVCRMVGKAADALNISFRAPGEMRLTPCPTKPALAELIVALKRDPTLAARVNVSYKAGATGGDREDIPAIPTITVVEVVEAVPKPKRRNLCEFLRDGEVVTAELRCDAGADVGAEASLEATFSHAAGAFITDCGERFRSPTAFCSHLKSVMFAEGMTRKAAFTGNSYEKCSVVRDGVSISLQALR